MTKEERLLNIIFNHDDNAPYCNPETHFEKADYAEYCLQKSLEFYPATLRRVSRLRGLLWAGKGEVPDIITRNETRMALKALGRVRFEIEEAYANLASVYNDTKGAAENVPTDNKTS